MYPLGNRRPDAPVIDGPPKGKIDVEYEYNFSIYDPDDDSMYLRVDWGNGTAGPWQGPYPSNTVVKLNHTWDEKGTYTIKAQVKDSYGAESEWGKLKVKMPKCEPFDLIATHKKIGGKGTICNTNIMQSVGIGYE
jgi:hypothetical protein